MENFRQRRDLVASCFTVSKFQVRWHDQVEHLVEGLGICECRDAVTRIVVLDMRDPLAFYLITGWNVNLQPVPVMVLLGDGHDARINGERMRVVFDQVPIILLRERVERWFSEVVTF